MAIFEDLEMRPALTLKSLQNIFNQICVLMLFPSWDYSYYFSSWYSGLLTVYVVHTSSFQTSNQENQEISASEEVILEEADPDGKFLRLRNKSGKVMLS